MTEIEALKADLARAESMVDLLESNARVQAKLLADTGRERDDLRHPTPTPLDNATHSKRLDDILQRCRDTGDHSIDLKDAHAITEASEFIKSIQGRHAPRQEELPRELIDQIRETGAFIRANTPPLTAAPRMPVAWGRVIDGKAITISLEQTPANDEPLYAGPAPTRFTPGDPVEIRMQNGEIDEIVIRRGDVHIEQMSADGWFMGVNGSDGSYWQFWFGSKNRKSHVEFRHTEHLTAEEERENRPAVTSTQPPDIEALCQDYAQRYFGSDFSWLFEHEQVDLRIEAHRWIKCWSAVAPQESQAKATKGKAGMAGVESDPVRRSTAGTGLQVGEASADLPATSEYMDVTDRRDDHLSQQGPLVPWELRCQQHPSECTAPECDCPAVSSTDGSGAA